MGVYTMELREVVSRYDIGLKTYPIFDEDYRSTLNTNIMNHFWYREIGTETVDQFVKMINDRMLLNMPTFNELYNSARFTYDPLSTIDIQTVTHQRGDSDTTSKNDEKSTTSGSVDNDSKSQSISSDYPAAMLSQAGDYASSGSNSSAKTLTENKANSVGSSVGESSSSTVSDGTTRTSGRQVSGAQLVLEYRQTIINIDRMVIDSLDSLFMRIWETNDNSFERAWWFW